MFSLDSHTGSVSDGKSSRVWSSRSCRNVLSSAWGCHWIVARRCASSISGLLDVCPDGCCCWQWSCIRSRRDLLRPDGCQLAERRPTKPASVGWTTVFQFDTKTCYCSEQKSMLAVKIAVFQHIQTVSNIFVQNVTSYVATTFCADRKVFFYHVLLCDLMEWSGWYSVSKGL